MRSLNFQKLNLHQEDILTKTQMKNILGGYNGGADGKKCTGTCSGGDRSTWTMSCTKPNEFSLCSCPRTDANTQNCKE